MKSRLLLLMAVVFLLVSGAAAQKKDHTCYLCSCGMAYSECDKSFCTEKRRKTDVCDMQCKDQCMHQKGGTYCPKKQPTKT